MVLLFITLAKPKRSQYRLTGRRHVMLLLVRVVSRVALGQEPLFTLLVIMTPMENLTMMLIGLITNYDRIFHRISRDAERDGKVLGRMVLMVLHVISDYRVTD